MKQVIVKVTRFLESGDEVSYVDVTPRENKSNSRKPKKKNKKEVNDDKDNSEEEQE